MSGSRAPWLVVVAVLALAAGGLAWWAGTSAPPGAAPAAVTSGGAGLGSGPVDEPASEAVVAAPARSHTAVEVLRRWDRARAGAYAAGDMTRLRSLYVRGSPAGTADAGVLRSYLRRGLRVDGMRMQLLAVRVLGHAPRRWRLRVTDRLHGAVAVDRAGERVALPRDQASTRVVTLVRRGGRWKVAAVLAAPPAR